MNKATQKTDEQKWDEMLDSAGGQDALKELMKQAQEDLDNGNFEEDE